MRKVQCSAFILMLVLMAGCSEARLTTRRAQVALDRWIASKSGRVEVLGVQEFPQQNNAKADLRFTDLPVKDAIWGRAETYSGPGTAIFTRYTDGRWVLNEINIPYQILTWWKDINIEVR